MMSTAVGCEIEILAGWWEMAKVTRMKWMMMTSGVGVGGEVEVGVGVEVEIRNENEVEIDNQRGQGQGQLLVDGQLTLRSQWRRWTLGLALGLALALVLALALDPLWLGLLRTGSVSAAAETSDHPPAVGGCFLFFCSGFLFYEAGNCHTLLGQALLGFQGSLAPATKRDSVRALGL